MTSDAPGLPWYGIAALAAVASGLFVAAVARAYGSLKTAGLAAVSALVWWAFTGALAASGTLQKFDARPPPLGLFMFGVLALAVAVGLSPVGRRLSTLPLAALVIAQSIRLPLELVMHRAATEQLMPSELSFSGYNFDIVTGAAALAVGVALMLGRAPRSLVWGWNVLGFATLAAIVVIAVLSSPMVRAFGDDPAHVNTWVTQVPYVWLPAVLVVFAVMGHVVVTRRLISDGRAQPK